MRHVQKYRGRAGQAGNEPRSTGHSCLSLGAMGGPIQSNPQEMTLGASLTASLHPQTFHHPRWKTGLMELLLSKRKGRRR